MQFKLALSYHYESCESGAYECLDVIQANEPDNPYALIMRAQVADEFPFAGQDLQ